MASSRSAGRPDMSALQDSISVSVPGLSAPFAAVLFGMEGVVVDITRVRSRAWQRLFGAVLPRLPSSPQPRVDPVRDWARPMDGQASRDGIRRFMDARGVELPDGEHEDERRTWSVHGLAKQQ